MVIYLLFLIVTALVMTVSILLVYKISQKLGLEINISSLAFCGVLAIIINFVSIFITPFLTSARYYVLVLLVVFATVSVTCYNEYLIRRRKTTIKPQDDAEQPLFAETPANTTDSISIGSFDNTPIVEASVDISYITPIEEASANITEVVTAIESAYDAAETATTAGSTDDIAEVVTAIEDIDDATDAAPEKNVITDTADITPAQDILEDMSEDTLAEEISTDTSGESSAENTNTSSSSPLSFNSLDETLDFAFMAKSQNHLEDALAAYQFALNNYQDDSYAPFIVVDICSLHKQVGNYTEAIDCLKQAMTMASIADNPAMLSEFHNTLRYLESTIEVLSMSGQENTPFDALSKETISTIESIYKSRESRLD